MLGSELEDSHLRKKKPKSGALYPLPKVRPSKGTRVISPQPSELLCSWGKGKEGLLCAGRDEKGFCPPHPWKRGAGGADRDVVWDGWSSSSICLVYWLSDEQDC